MADVTGPDVPTLRSMASVPSLPEYLAELWRRREFTLSLATGSLRGQYLETTLGNVWHVLNPALMMAVYWLVFGVPLGADRGLAEGLFVPFLGVGIFTFQLSQRIVSSCGSSITNNLNLIRSLQFPRAVLPLASVAEQVTGFGMSVVVIVGIIFASGRPPTLSWVLAPVVIALLTIFSAGVGMVVARLTDSIRDVANVIPFVFRLLFYLSGVIFSLDAFVRQPRLDELGVPLSASFVRHLFVLNPFFTYIELLRDVLLVDYAAEHARDAWIVAVVYAPVSFVLGLLYFRRGEKTYGRG